MSGDSGYEASEEDLRIMDLYYVARDAGLSHQEAQSSAFQQVAQETTLPTAPTGGGGYEVINIGTQDSPETILVDPSGQFIASVEKTGYNQYGAIGGGGDAGASTLESFNASNLSSQAKDKADNVFGEGFGQAIGRPYELLNADGEPYRRFDAKGNLTEFVDRLTGNWAKASDVKPVGTAFDSLAGALVTEFEYGGNKFAPMEGGGGAEYASFMDPYFKDKGGFFGEGGLAKIATLVAAGFAPFALPYLSAGLTAAGATGALGTAGAAGIYGGLTTVGKGLLSGKSFEDSLVDGLKSGAISAVTAGVLSGLSPDVASGLGEEFGDIINAGNSEEGIGSFLDAVKESGGQFTGDMSGAGSDMTFDDGAGSDMTFDDLVSSTGATQGKGDIEDYYDAAKEISRTNENDVYEALKKYFSAGYEGVPVPGSETAALTTVGATPEQINDLEAMGIKLPQVGGNYSKWHEFADDPSSMVIPPVTNQEIPLVDLTKDGVLSYNDLLDYLTETVGQYGTISKDGVVTGIPDYIKNNINNLLGTSAGIAGLAALIKGGQLAGLGGTGTGGGSSGAGEGSGDGVGDGVGDGGGTGGGGAGGIGGGGAGGGGGGGGGTGNGAGESNTDLELKKQNLNQALSAQIQPVIVKPPPVAEIDYMYDIGGESVFATPKQETLMPSPFEEAPEAVEGAMPRYQYYDPSGGYQYADGGMVAFDEGGDVTQEELEAAARPLTYNPKIAASGERSRRDKEEALTRQQQPPEDTYVDEYGRVRNFSEYGRADPTLEDTTYRLTGMQPGLDRSMILPHNPQIGWHVPEFIYGGIKSILSPEQAYKYGNVSDKESIETAMNVMGGGLGVSSGMRNPTGVVRGTDLGMQIGPNAAKHWDQASADFAEHLLQQNFSPKYLKGMTGTEQFPIYSNRRQENLNATGPWANVGFQEELNLGSKFFQEISDKDAVYKPPFGRVKGVVDNLLDFYRIKDMPDSEPTVKMSEVLKHPKLYEAYPEIKDMQVSYYSGRGNDHGYFNPETGVIGINKNISKDNQLDTILHEIQHHIQTRESWLGGANPDMYRSYVIDKLPPEELAKLQSASPDANKIWQKIEQQAFDMYQRNQGEAAARATSARRNLDDRQIYGTPTKYDVPEHEITPYEVGGLVGSDDYTIDDLYELLRGK